MRNNMKRLNNNILVFVICMIFLGVGIFSFDFYSEIGEAFRSSLDGDTSKFSKIAALEKKIDSVSSDKLLYHNHLMDLNSIKENLLGTRIIKKSDAKVIKSDSDSLYQTYEEFSNQQIKNAVSRINSLYQECQKNGAYFLYVLAPRKGDYYSTPSNIINHSRTNYTNYVNEINHQEIPVLDFEKVFIDKMPEEIFYYTDHHWTSRMGFNATGEICRELNDRYGFCFDENIIDITQYNTNIYQNIFLGSYGKKTGAFFSWKGYDDFELITPSFETDLSNNVAYKNEYREGDFNESFLDLSKLGANDCYSEDPYYVYLGGDYRLQKIKNNLNSTGKKLLIIRDSFGIPVVPFISLQMAETHVVDVRVGDKYIGDKVNVYKYIESYKPDYVLVLYSGADCIESENGRFDFE